jgi:hypothetical protein
MNRLAIIMLVSGGIVLRVDCAKVGAKSKIGAEEMPVKLVVNVDDLGFSPDAAEGAVRLWRAGAITSVSVMTFGDDFDHTIELLRESEVPTGVHLALEYGTALALPDHMYFDSTRAALAAESLGTSVSLVGIYELPRGAEETLENRRAAYEELLSSLKPGLNHLYSHPARPTDSVKAMYGDHPIRNDDYALFMSAEWKIMLLKKKIELAGY